MIDDRDRYAGAAELTGNLNAAEAAAYDDDVRLSRGIGGAHTSISGDTAGSFMSIGESGLARSDGRACRQLVTDDLAALHDKFDPLKLGDVRKRIARHRDEVGVLALVDRTDVVLPAQHFGVVDGSGLDRLRGGQLRVLDQRFVVERLRAVRVGRAVDTAPIIIFISLRRPPRLRRSETVLAPFCRCRP
jgi:hypothetical protein